MCITKTELEQKVQELRSLKAMKEELENEVKAVEHEVILYMTEHNLDSEITDSALDKDKLKDILGDDLKPFERTTSYNVLRIR